MTAQFSVTLTTPATADEVWDQLWNPAAHTAAIPLTTVTGSFVAGSVLARTRIGPIALDDPMTVTSFEPPVVAPDPAPGRCTIRKTGSWVLGEVNVVCEPLLMGGTRVHWRQDIAIRGLPAVADPLVGGVARIAYGLCLRRILASTA